MQGYELSISKTYVTADGSLLLLLSRDDISGIFDDDTYIPRISPAKNTFTMKYESKNNDTYYADLIYTESQDDKSSIESGTSSYIDLDL